MRALADGRRLGINRHMQSGIPCAYLILAGTEVDNFGCTWTLCSTQSGDGWPQRSQLQPGVPSLGRCVSLLPATFCNLGLGDPLSSCKKRIVFISYSLFAWRTYARRDRKTSRGLAFCFAKLA